MMVPTSERLEVICYLDWCGAEAVFRFGRREQYEAARQFLNELSTGRLGAKSAIVGSAPQSSFYFIDSKDRETFQNFMQKTALRAPQRD